MPTSSDPAALYDYPMSLYTCAYTAALTASRLSSNYIIYDIIMRTIICKLSPLYCIIRAPSWRHTDIGETTYYRDPISKYIILRDDSATFYTSRVRTSSPPRYFEIGLRHEAVSRVCGFGGWGGGNLKPLTYYKISQLRNPSCGTPLGLD